MIIVVVVAVLLVLTYVALTDATKKATVHPAISRSRTSSAPPNIDADALARAVGPAVVGVDATLAGGVHSYASGMLLTSAGEVITNNNAIAGATAIAVKADAGKTYAATVRGYDVSDDVAVLGLDGASGLPTINLGDAATVRVGDPLVAVGRSAGSNEVTRQAGSVTALHRQIAAGDASDPSGIESLHDMVQLDAPTRPSDSGGPIVDAHGKVIAMSTAASAGRRFHEQSAGHDLRDSDRHRGWGCRPRRRRCEHRNGAPRSDCSVRSCSHIRSGRRKRTRRARPARRTSRCRGPRPERGHRLGRRCHDRDWCGSRHDLEPSPARRGRARRLGRHHRNVPHERYPARIRSTGLSSDALLAVGVERMRTELLF